MTDQSPTRDLIVAVSARHLTDPNEARRLAYGLGELIRYDVARGRSQIAGFLEDVRAALTDYADELERSHDQVVRDVMRTWTPALDEGPLDPGGVGPIEGGEPS